MLLQSCLSTILLLIPDWVPEWLNYPGLELWKFLNLGIFIAVGIYILRLPISNSLAARQERIRQEIARAEKEREEAAAELAAAHAQVAHLSVDLDAIRKHADKEVDDERKRLAGAADQEIERLNIQASRELERARKGAQVALQQFLASRSLEIARHSVASQLRPEDDSRFIKDRLDELRRVRG